MILIKPATQAHVDTIQLRKVDASEVTANWREQLTANLNGAFAALQPDGSVVALFGVVEGAREVGVWLLSSEAIEQHKSTAWRLAKRLVQHLRNDSRLVFNFIPKHSHGNRRFVERLGFRILSSPGNGHDLFYLS